MKAGRSAQATRTPATPALPWAGIAIVLACVAFALWVQRRALGGFFSLDDLVIIEEVRGLREATPGLWRLLSRYLYFGAAVPLFGSNPFPYHLVSALVHGANVALLYLFVRRRSGGVLAGVVAAGLFGTSRLHLTAIGSAATIGEPLALGFTLGALLLHDRGRIARLVAPVLMLFALFSKESVALLPAVLLLPHPAGGPLRERLRLALPLLIVGAVFASGLLASGAGATHLGGQAYAQALGPNLFLNLMTYTRWVVDMGDPFPGLVSAIAPDAWPAGAAATVLLAILARVARRAALPPALGVSWWLLALLPVLPLLHHSYLYYLYVPMAGIAMVAAGMAGWAERWAVARSGRPGDRRGAGTARSRGTPGAATRQARTGALPAIIRSLVIALVIAHGVHADRLLAGRYAARMGGTGIALDPDLRKSEIARHASEAVGKRLSGRPGRVAFLLPAGLEQVYSTATGELREAASDSGSYSMIAGALDDGRGLRALHPNVDSVVFLRGWSAGHGDFEMFSQGRDGTVYPLGRGADGYAEAGAAIIAGGAPGPARLLLEGALSEFPDHAPLRYQYARWFYKAGDTLAMRRQLDELMRRTPDHPLAARVRASFPAAGGRR